MWELFNESQISDLKRLGFEFGEHTVDPVIKLNGLSVSIMSDSVNRDDDKGTLSFLVWLVIPNNDVLCGEFIFMANNASPYSFVLMTLENIVEFLGKRDYYKKELEKHLEKLSLKTVTKAIV